MTSDKNVHLIPEELISITPAKASWRDNSVSKRLSHKTLVQISRTHIKVDIIAHLLLQEDVRQRQGKICNLMDQPVWSIQWKNNQETLSEGRQKTSPNT